MSFCKKKTKNPAKFPDNKAKSVIESRFSAMIGFDASSQNDLYVISIIKTAALIMNNAGDVVFAIPKNVRIIISILSKIVVIIEFS